MYNHTQQRRHMPIKCAAIFQNRIWISSYLYNALYCYDIEDGSMEYLGKFENQDMRDNLHRQIIRCGDRLFFVPIRADGVDVYNIKERCFEDTIKYRCDEKVTNKVALQISDEMVMLFPQNIREPLYVLHTKEKKMEILFAWKKEIDKIFSDNGTYLISASGICTDEKSIYVAIFKKGIILKIDRKTFDIKKVFSDENYHFASINCFGEAFYLTEAEKSGIVHIEKNRVINKIENSEIADVHSPFCGMVQVENGFLIIPHHLNNFYVLDTREKVLQKADIHFEKKESPEPCFFNWQTYAGNIVLYPARAQSVLTINCKNLSTHEIDLTIPDDITDQWIKKNQFEIHYREDKGVFSEDNFSLEDFMMLVEKGRRVDKNDAETIGEEIHISVNREMVV